MPLYGQPTSTLSEKQEIVGVTSSGLAGASADFSKPIDLNTSAHRYLGLVLHKLSLGTATRVLIGLQVSNDKEQWFDVHHTSDADLVDPLVVALQLTTETNPSVSPDVSTETGKFYPMATFFGTQPLPVMMDFARLKIWANGGSPGDDAEIEYQVVTF